MHKGNLLQSEDTSGFNNFSNVFRFTGEADFGRLIENSLKARAELYVALYLAAL